MFNTYTDNNGDVPFFYEPSENAGEKNSPAYEDVFNGNKAKEQPKGLLKSLFSGNKAGNLFDTDTLLVILMVFFLLSDGDKEDKKDTKDTIIIAALLLLLGL